MPGYDCQYQLPVAVGLLFSAYLTEEPHVALALMRLVVGIQTRSGLWDGHLRSLMVGQ
jgi:hypothetical protein